MGIVAISEEESRDAAFLQGLSENAGLYQLGAGLYLGVMLVRSLLLYSSLMELLEIKCFVSVTQYLVFCCDLLR